MIKIRKIIRSKEIFVKNLLNAGKCHFKCLGENTENETFIKILS